MPDITIVVRMDADNRLPLDFYLFPRLDVASDRVRLAEDNGLSLDAYRFDTLDYAGIHHVPLIAPDDADKSDVSRQPCAPRYQSFVHRPSGAAAFVLVGQLQGTPSRLCFRGGKGSISGVQFAF